MSGVSSFKTRFPIALAIWTAVCGVAAVPSFAIAYSSDFDPGGMVIGVLVFVIGYATSTSTDRFQKYWKTNPAFARSVTIGYVCRVLVSIAFPIGVAIDIVPGSIAVDMVGAFGLHEHKFLKAFLTTLVQGALLNVILGVFMAVLYALIRPFVKPTECQPRGFMVIQQPGSPQSPDPMA